MFPLVQVVLLEIKVFAPHVPTVTTAWVASLVLSALADLGLSNSFLQEFRPKAIANPQKVDSFNKRNLFFIIEKSLGFGFLNFWWFYKVKWRAGVNIFKN